MPLSAQSTGTENGHEWVDLGLPSGLKWATCNVGASSPEKFGNYYAWGETKPKDEYIQANSLTYNKEFDDFSGNVQYDAATANWGGDWRMPTLGEMKELRNNCTWEWIKQNGVRGYKVTGPNGNSIFLPAVGYFLGSTFNSESCGRSCYWTSAPSATTSNHVASILSFNSSSIGIKNANDSENYRYIGYSVRPVKSRIGIETPCVAASVVEFTDLTAIIKTYATDGGAEITERGLYYGTNPNPSETDNKVVLENEVGWITNMLIDLTPNTTYYVKAYATNEAGTSYSEVMTFTTLDEVVHDYVDLGLPSGLKWATCNVGANSPEKYGNYYAWGEIMTKEEYTQSNSLTEGKQMDDISGNAQYDAATANWGGDWRMPTKAEIQELIDKCTWTWTTQNGVNGYKVTGPSGASIFLPAAGYFSGTTFNSGSYSYYWSSTPSSNTNNAYYLVFKSGSRSTSDSSRYFGYTVRPVKSRIGIETPFVTASVVEFTDLTAIIKTYATDGGAEITERGLYYGTNPNPSETDNKVVLENEVGWITNMLIDLTPNTTYYVKAYATNEAGTSYSEVMTFTTLDEVVHDYVDLGLPSGLKWATCNIGANSPEEYGNYYAWGEVMTKDTYTEANSLTYNKQIDDISGNAQYDAATANWGGDWRMPTKAEMQELINKCTWTWTNTPEFKGYIVKGPNGNRIFLPAAGYRNGSSLYFAGSGGYYWSSAPDGSSSFYAYGLYFDSSSQYMSRYYRDYGRSVRPVIE